MDFSNTLIRQLIQLLNQKTPYTDTALAHQLGITQSVILQYLHILQNVGLDIHLVSDHTYQLKQPIRLCDTQLITKYWPDYLKNKVALKAHFSVSSTNDEIKKMNMMKPIKVCVSDHQTAGRGCQGRSWISSLGSGIYYSYAYQRKNNSATLAGLSLTVGLALIKTLLQFNISDLSLKWPNDVLWQSKKIAGVLIELTGDIKQDYHLVIGIGLNLCLSPKSHQALNSLASDLYRITGKMIDKNKLISEITIQLYDHLSKFDRMGFSYFTDDWNQYDAYRDQLVVFHVGSKKYQGIGIGVNNTGHFLLSTDHQNRVSFPSGEIQVKSSAERWCSRPESNR